MVTELNSSNFKEFISSNDMVLIDFYADWCAPCMMMGPIVEAYAENHSGIKVAKVNIDDEPALAAENKVVSIPNLLIFKGGEFAKRSIGALSKAELEAFVESV